MTASGRHYLDHASTTALRPEAARAMTAWLEGKQTGDPGRVHTEGRVVRDAVERAREAVATLLGTTANRVVFTSGGTEAANVADLRGGHGPTRGTNGVRGRWSIPASKRPQSGPGLCSVSRWTRQVGSISTTSQPCSLPRARSDRRS